MQRRRLAASSCSKRRRCGGLAMVRSPSGSPAFCSTGIFFVALILYAALTVLWVWILSFTQLSRTYPFLALAFASRQRLVASFLPNRCDTARDLHRARLVGFSSLGG